MRNSLTVTQQKKIKIIWVDRINEWDSKKIIQKELEESIEWGRRYGEKYAKNIEIK